MKSYKTLLKVLLVVLLLSPFLLYAGIVITNNCISYGLALNLRGIQLPADTEFVDSMSITGKISGNGNGMQHFGAILVSSDLSREELQTYYGSVSDSIRVKEQTTATIFDSSSMDFFNPSFDHYQFDNFPSEGNTYMIYQWKYNTSKFGDADFISKLLDLDLRGH